MMKRQLRGQPDLALLPMLSAEGGERAELPLKMYPAWGTGMDHLARIIPRCLKQHRAMIDQQSSS